MLREAILISGSTISIISVCIGNLYYYRLEKRFACSSANSLFMKVIFSCLLVFHIFHVSRNLAYPLVDKKPFKYYISIEYPTNLFLNLTAQLIFLSAIGLELPIWVNLLRRGTGSPFKQKMASFISDRGRSLVFLFMSISIALAFTSICILPRAVMSNLLVMYGSLYVNIPIVTLSILPITLHMILILVNTIGPRRPVVLENTSANTEIVRRVRLEALKLLAANVLILSYGWIWIFAFGASLSRSKFMDPGLEAYELEYRLGPSDSIGVLAMTICWAGFLTFMVFLGVGEPSNRIRKYFRAETVFDRKTIIKAKPEMATQDFLSTSVGAKAIDTIGGKSTDYDGKSLAMREINDG